MTPPDPALYFVRDLGQILRERAIEAKLDREAAADSDDEDLKLGRLMGFYEVLTLIEEQAEAFGLGRDEVGLQDFSAERDLL